MSLILRNFFFAVGITTLLFLNSLNPATASFGDLVRLAQSETALSVVELLTIVLVALELVVGGFGNGMCVSIPVRERKVRGSGQPSALSEPAPADAS